MMKHQMLLRVILNFCHLFSVSSYCEVQSQCNLIAPNLASFNILLKECSGYSIVSMDSIMSVTITLAMEV